MTAQPSRFLLALAIALCGCARAKRPVASSSGGLPAPAFAAPVPFHTTEPRFGTLPAAPWPPATWDSAHWLGPGTGRARPFALPAGGSIATLGCPFPALELPPCPDGIEAVAPQALTDRTDLSNQVVTVTAVLRAHMTRQWSFRYLLAEDRKHGVKLPVLGILQLGESLGLYDFEPWCDLAPCPDGDPRFLCFGDGTGECCGVQSDRRVVARGRLQESSGGYLYAPLVCDLGTRPVRLVALPRRSP